MTNELIKILSDLKELIDDRNAGKIPGEDEFLTGIRQANAELTEELKKPQAVQDSIK